MMGKTKRDTKVIKVGLVQMSCEARKQANLDKALDLIAQAARQGARIICLQELFSTLYFCQREDDRNFALAEPIPGPTTEALASAAAALRVVLVGSVFEKRTEGLYHNTAVLFDADGSLRGQYRKMHIPDDPCFYEKFYFTPGDARPGFQAHKSAYGSVGMLVCWDQWFPEAARLTALAGAQVLFYPTAIGWQRNEQPQIKTAQAQAWELIQRSHALANGCFVCAVNRTGREGRLTFWGGSFIADPFGRVLARGSTDKDEIVLADCDLELIGHTRRHWPFLRDRRVDAYGGLEYRFLD